jgi:hypothetical protein
MFGVVRGGAGRVGADHPSVLVTSLKFLSGSIQSTDTVFIKKGGKRAESVHTSDNGVVILHIISVPLSVSVSVRV